MVSIRSLVRRLRHTRHHRPDIMIGHLHFGSDYGGWPVISNLVGPESIVYAVGVGTDATFDLELIGNTGCTVHAFDPTPRSRTWVESREWPDRWIFHSLGVAGKDDTVAFFEPANSRHVSYSAAPSAPTAIATELPVRRLSTIMEDLGHNRIDLLKMDIEGFEYDVIADLTEGAIRPTQLLVEFHHDMYGIPVTKTMDAVTHLHNQGFRIFSVSDNGREYGFVYSNKYCP